MDGVAGVELAVGCGEQAGLGRHEQEVEPGRRQQPRPQLLVGGGAEQAPVERDQGEVEHSATRICNETMNGYLVKRVSTINI